MSEVKWIDKYLSKPLSKLLVRVDDDFLTSHFNYYGLKTKVNNFQKAYELITNGIVVESPSKNKATTFTESASESNINPNTTMEQDEKDGSSDIEESAANLYGLIHARFIQKSRGLQLMHEKFKKGDFPCCPRYYCKSFLLPFGEEEEELGQDVRWYCPVCNDVYAIDRIYNNGEDIPDYSDSDGGFFGHSWVYLFRQKYVSEIAPKGPIKVYVPRIFGFPISHPKDSSSDDNSESA
ncbi:hypothetical protein M9Y10_041542 [Tritrichomonas musculus]|uniref:Casein kinase II subunit beta n=1 Tax=Tritrichomonas musculus TaxID=1915356 RepID=A0ABR2K6F6_9EUKA